MNLRIAEKNDFDRVVEFYKNVIENTENMSKYGCWIYGLHPTDDVIRSYIESSCMYLMENDGRITAAVAVTLSQDEDYHSVKWSTNLDDTDVAVIHLLCVSPQEQKQGSAKRVMQEIISMIRAKRKKAIRLDALFCNTPAHRLYESLGFKKCDVKNWYAKNTGWIDFYLFELVFEQACYFIVDTYIDENKGRCLYDDYIEKVKPIVESFGGEYLVRTEKITSLSCSRNPQRVIIIRFPSRKMLKSCFQSEEYKAIMNERICSVDARALIAEGEVD